jgi:D-glycero-D-manno-heptose 1,7-bisphosphate phosphatase
VPATASAPKRAVFFDRDGTLNEDIGYLGDPHRLRLFAETPAAVHAVREAGFLAVVISNQSGIARGLIAPAQVAAVNARLVELLKVHGTDIDGLYFCPHHPQGKVEAYRADCACRKPAPGLVLQAAEELGIDVPHSFMIGDKAADVMLGKNAGCRAVLVRTGYGNMALSELEAQGVRPDYVAVDVGDAVQWILMEID